MILPAEEELLDGTANFIDEKYIIDKLDAALDYKL